MPLLVQLHANFLSNLITEFKDDSTLESALADYVKIGGIYWIVSSCFLLKKPELISDQKSILDFVNSCFVIEDGGYGSAPGHDSHILNALYAVLIYGMLQKPFPHKKELLQYVANRQNADGSFCGDKWGEVDTRFFVAALGICWLLKDSSLIDVHRATDFINQCNNFDGGYGSVPGAESHAGQSKHRAHENAHLFLVFCCVSSLRMISHILHENDPSAASKGLDQLGVPIERLSWWLAHRQLPCGGFNGRPEKQEDVCYSWWVLSSLAVLERVQWIDRRSLIDFMLSCQVNVDF